MLIVKYKPRINQYTIFMQNILLSLSQICSSFEGYPWVTWWVSHKKLVSPQFFGGDRVAHFF
jgi:hypothetical protein